jgi:hypothetical protein
MSKPQKTAADYMVIALSPALIMALVGSLCFFLVGVFYRGLMVGGVYWVLFWFIIGIVLVSRIAIEKSTDYAFMYGLGLAVATCLYMMRTQPGYLLGVVLLTIVWFCAHKLVWDCTLIDEDQDSSGQGLLQKKAAPAKQPRRRLKASQAPGRWVVYFSLAALPLFGVGQMLLPATAAGQRQAGLIFLAVYLAAALGLLLTTSFLGLRRYLRQRYLVMPGTIAAAWLKFGLSVALVVLIGAVFLPRPGANAAWAALHYQIDYQLRRASDYASAPNASGQGQGRAGNQPNGQQQGNSQQPGRDKTAETQTTSQTASAPPVPAGQAGNIYNFLRAALAIVAILVVGGWVIRRRYLLMEMLRSIMAAIAKFFRDFGEIRLSRKRAVENAAQPVVAKFNSFVEYRNPFFAAKDHAWPPEQIMIYTYEAARVWAREQGIELKPEETAREFCARLGGERPQLDSSLGRLAHFYGYAAYGTKLPPDSDLEPVKELWRYMTAVSAHHVPA